MRKTSLAVAAVTLLAACATPRTIAARRAALLDRARVCAREGHYNASARAYEQALAIQPRDADALQELGAVYAQLDAAQEAADRYAKALELAPDDYVLHVRLAELLAGLGALERARREFDAAKKLDSRQADAYVREGYADLRAGDYGRAKDDFSMAVAVDTGNASGYVHLGNFYYWSRKDYPRADKLYQKAVALLQADAHAPQEKLFWAMGAMASVRQAQGRLEDAEAILRSILAKETRIDDRVSTLNGLARLEIDRKHARQAEGLLKQAAAECEADAGCSAAAQVHLWAGTRLALAEFYAARGRKAQARAEADREWLAYDESSGAIPNLIENVRIMMRTGAVYRRILDDAAAERVYRRVLSLRDSIGPASSLIEADADLADICARSGRKEEAARLLRDASGLARSRGEASEAADLARRSESMGGLQGERE